jgi:hypothetical protein
MTTSARRLPGVAERCLNQGGLGVSVPARRKEPIPRSLPFRPQATSTPERRDMHRMAGTFTA